MMLYTRGSRAGNLITLLKRTVSVISSKRSFKNDYARFNNVEDNDVLLGLKGSISIRFTRVKVFNFYMFSWSRNGQITFEQKPRLAKKNLFKTLNIKYRSFRLNQTTIFRVPLWIRHWYFCMKGHFKLRSHSLYKQY